MPLYEQFDEIYSISDLHLSDERGMDVESVAALTNTVKCLEARAKKTRLPTALVVNGDIVDFLDVEPADYFDALRAPAKLERIIAANEVLWNAFNAYSSVGTLILTLGNHDVELAMPACQAMLRSRITGGLILAFDGSGYRCRTGNTTAFFVHGNNEDEWNTIDFDLLGRIAAAVAAGRPHETWIANEGTKLVIELLNKQKHSHPFLEYVKPEKLWLLELVAKLGFAGLASQLHELVGRQAKARQRHWRRSRSPQAAYLGRGQDFAEQLNATMFDAEQLLLRADAQFRAGARILESPNLRTGKLGLSMRDLFRVERAPESEIRDHIVRSLVGETAFLFDQTDDLYRALGPKLERGIHWVVCGHTHLRRAYQDRSDRAYFNSGTWMRLIDLYDVANTDGQFGSVMKALDASSRDQLDEIRWTSADGSERQIVHREPTVVVLRSGEGWLANGVESSSNPTELTRLGGSLRRVAP